MRTEAGAYVLGAILIDGEEALIKTADLLDFSDFLKTSEQRIFAAMLDVWQEGQPVDLVTVSESLKEKGELDQVGGIDALTEMANDVPTAANVLYYAQKVKDAAIRRRVHTWSLEISKQAKEGTEDLRGWFGEIEKGVISLAETVREKKSPYALDILREIEQDWNKETPGAKTHIPCPLFKPFNLQASIPGAYPGHMWVIGGYTSTGKSTFLAQNITDFCLAGAAGAVFSTEDSRKEKLLKLIANLADISQRRLITGQIEGFKDRISAAREIVRKWNLTIYDDVYTADEIRLKAKKHKLQKGLDFIALDYIQNLKGTGSLYERMSHAATTLFALGKELNVTVIVLSQVSNESMKEGSELLGFKGAGEIAAAADIALWLKRHRGADKEHWLDCEIRKNRPFGETGIVPLKFSDYWTRIERRN